MINNKCLALLAPIREIGSVYPASDYRGKAFENPVLRQKYVGAGLELNWC
jgi:hypothetical protein